MSIWRVDGSLKQIGPEGWTVVKQVSLDGVDWEGLAISMARYELQLSIDEPDKMVDWETLTEIDRVEPINSYVLEKVNAYRQDMWTRMHEPDKPK